jgi:hypothetical protein
MVWRFMGKLLVVSILENDEVLMGDQGPMATSSSNSSTTMSTSGPTPTAAQSKTAAASRSKSSKP